MTSNKVELTLTVVAINLKYFTSTGGINTNISIDMKHSILRKFETTTGTARYRHNVQYNFVAVKPRNLNKYS